MNTVERTGLGVDVVGEHDEREAALTELRKRLDDGLAHVRLTKTQLAARTGLGRTTVQAAFQTGGPVPSAATVAALADKLGLPIEQLLELRRAAADEAGPVDAGDEGPGKPIREWDPHDLEVHPAGTATAVAGSGSRSQLALPGYVRRDHDQVLAEATLAVREGRSRMLVLVGSSSTGKTRACWEAVQPLAAEGWRLWHPHDPTRAEAALADLERVAPRTVVWLNGAQHYLGHPQAGERIAASLHTLLTHPDRQPVLVLGTLWPEYADSYTALACPGEPDPHSRVRELLTGHTLTVPTRTPAPIRTRHPARQSPAGSRDGRPPPRRRTPPPANLPHRRRHRLPHRPRLRPAHRRLGRSRLRRPRPPRPRQTSPPTPHPPPPRAAHRAARHPPRRPPRRRDRSSASPTTSNSTAVPPAANSARPPPSGTPPTPTSPTPTTSTTSPPPPTRGTACSGPTTSGTGPPTPATLAPCPTWRRCGRRPGTGRALKPSPARPPTPATPRP